MFAGSMYYTAHVDRKHIRHLLTNEYNGGKTDVFSNSLWCKLHILKIHVAM